MIKFCLKKLLVLLEHLLNSFVSEKKSLGIVYVVGLPRSGTTLAYQLVAECENVRPLYNIENWYSDMPIITSYLTVLKKFWRNNDAFASRFGRTRGLFGVSEGAQVLSGYRTSENLLLTNCLKKYLSKKHTASAKYFALKNVYFIENLSQVQCFDNSFFVFIERAPSEIIRSICAARLSLGISEDVPWSYCPTHIRTNWKNYEYPENVRMQVAIAQEELTELKNRIPEASKIEVNYEDFKQNHSVLKIRFENALRA